ncbi:MAG TPA: hypothetical protein VGY56_08390 [Verrucomicrobiae bacterium]|nr:hypothetical protein [Verrucomicrobiae bacterium]
MKKGAGPISNESSTVPNAGQCTGTGLRAARAVARDRGVSPITVWRWRRRGWISIVNISGKPYVDLASLARFDERARMGEFSQPPPGAARKSAEARAKREMAGKTEDANQLGDLLG